MSDVEHGLGRLPFVADERDYILAAHPGLAEPRKLPARRLWRSARVLNQGESNHCVGFSWCGWGIARPVCTAYTTRDGHAIYRECKVLDGDPSGENGSYIRSGAKAMAARGRIASYYCSDADDWDALTAFVLGVGPVVIGIAWTADMFAPVAGIIRPTGPVRGGHAILWRGLDTVSGMARLRNSWGAGWGRKGDCLIRASELRALLRDGGEAWAAKEARHD
ncbi:MAG TPA: C1 family peptidase [Rubrivivax sp.]|nr:C1 family peptidase [Rubrivivax sp.]